MGSLSPLAGIRYSLRSPYESTSQSFNFQPYSRYAAMERSQTRYGSSSRVSSFVRELLARKNKYKRVIQVELGAKRCQFVKNKN
jgi:hypothetical protein